MHHCVDFVIFASEAVNRIVENISVHEIDLPVNPWRLKFMIAAYSEEDLLACGWLREFLRRYCHGLFFDVVVISNFIVFL